MMMIPAVLYRARFVTLYMTVPTVLYGARSDVCQTLHDDNPRCAVQSKVCPALHYDNSCCAVHFSDFGVRKVRYGLISLTS